MARNTGFRVRAARRASRLQDNGIVVSGRIGFCRGERGICFPRLLQRALAEHNGRKNPNSFSSRSSVQML
jgi:hypothetical protein